MIAAIIVFFLVSVVLSMVGLGGGAFYVPILLALGYGFPEASSTSLFLIMVTGLSAFSRFQKAKLVDWQLALVMDLFTDIGAFVGGYTAFHFNDRYLKIGFGILLVLAAYFILRMQKQAKTSSGPRTGFGYWQREFGDYRYSILVPAVIPITFIIGYASGMLGVAGGLLKIPIMVLWFGVPAKVAVATSSLMVGLTGLLGFGGHLFTGKIDWLLAIGTAIVVFTGGQIGAQISIQLPEKKIKKVLAVVFFLLALWMIVNALMF
ncbi:MAG: sulfite exporter TauE/SafE family protein [Calditrichia bacterium]